MSWLERIQTTYDRETELGFGPVTVDVDPAGWKDSLRAARDTLGCRFFDYLTAVDDLDDGFLLACHVAAPRVGQVDTLLLRTRLPRDDAAVDCVCAEYAGAGWHERETHEMFGIGFVGHDRLDSLLLPEGFEGHPLRKDFVLAARVAKAWPGAKEPGESGRDRAASPSRRRARPPGVPDPAQWGPSVPPRSSGGSDDRG